MGPELLKLSSNVDECKPLLLGRIRLEGRGVGAAATGTLWVNSQAPLRGMATETLADTRQGLTLVHFSALT